MDCFSAAGPRAGSVSTLGLRSQCAGQTFSGQTRILRAQKSIGYSLLREAVHSTHRWPILGSTYRAIYHAAANAVKSLAKKTPPIDGLYVRHSYALGTWEPGRSDIDFTVIWSDPQEKAIREFQRAYTKLRNRFPMIGEVEIIDTNHFAAWARYGFTGLHSSQWKKLAGPHRVQRTYSGSEKLDRLRYAASIYRHQFLQYFWDGAPEHVLARVTAKFFNLLGSSANPKGSPDHLLKECLAELSRAVKSLAAPSNGAPNDIVARIGKLKPPRLAVPSPSVRGVRSVIALLVNPSQKHVFVEGNYDLAQIKSLYPGAILWTGDAFRFFASYVDPLEYFAIVRERVLFHGEDLPRDVISLTEDALREAICHYSTDMLTYPYRGDLAELSDRDFDNILFGWYLRVLRYFEDGMLDYDYRTLRPYIGTRFHHHASRFAKLHAITGEIAAHLSADAPSTVAQDLVHSVIST
jgi:hypothetical protein